MSLLDNLENQLNQFKKVVENIQERLNNLKQNEVSEKSRLVDMWGDSVNKVFGDYEQIYGYVTQENDNLVKKCESLKNQIGNAIQAIENIRQSTEKSENTSSEYISNYLTEIEKEFNELCKAFEKDERTHRTYLDEGIMIYDFEKEFWDTQNNIRNIKNDNVRNFFLQVLNQIMDGNLGRSANETEKANMVKMAYYQVFVKDILEMERKVESINSSGNRKEYEEFVERIIKALSDKAESDYKQIYKRLRNGEAVEEIKQKEREAVARATNLSLEDFFNWVKGGASPEGLESNQNSSDLSEESGEGSSEEGKSAGSGDTEQGNTKSPRDTLREFLEILKTLDSSSDLSIGQLTEKVKEANDLESQLNNMELGGKLSSTFKKAKKHKQKIFYKMKKNRNNNRSSSSEESSSSSEKAVSVYSGKSLSVNGLVDEYLGVLQSLEEDNLSEEDFDQMVKGANDLENQLEGKDLGKLSSTFKLAKKNKKNIIKKNNKKRSSSSEGDVSSSASKTAEGGENVSSDNSNVGTEGHKREHEDIQDEVAKEWANALSDDGGKGKKDKSDSGEKTGEDTGSVDQDELAKEWADALSDDGGKGKQDESDSGKSE